MLNVWRIYVPLLATTPLSADTTFLDESADCGVANAGLCCNLTYRAHPLAHNFRITPDGLSYISQIVTINLY
jgi:hypothetical protein